MNSWKNSNRTETILDSFWRVALASAGQALPRCGASSRKRREAQELARQLARNATRPTRSNTRWIREENGRLKRTQSARTLRRRGIRQGAEPAPGDVEMQPPSPTMARRGRRRLALSLSPSARSTRGWMASPVGTKVSIAADETACVVALNGPTWAGNFHSPACRTRQNIFIYFFQEFS